MIKPLTAADVRDRIAKAPAAERAALIELAWSCVDMGVTLGLAGEARFANPFEQMLPKPAQVVSKPRGKAR